MSTSLLHKQNFNNIFATNIAHQKAFNCSCSLVHSDCDTSGVVDVSQTELFTARCDDPLPCTRFTAMIERLLTQEKLKDPERPDSWNTGSQVQQLLRSPSTFIVTNQEILYPQRTPGCLQWNPDGMRGVLKKRSTSGSISPALTEMEDQPAEETNLLSTTVKDPITKEGRHHILT